MKLPKSTIENFSGESKNFTEILNSFESSVDKNESLTQVEKFTCIKSFLIGQAANIVSGFEFTSENYDSCVKSLKSRFGKRDLVINSFMTEMLNLEDIKYSTNVRALRKLYDELDILIRNLHP